MKEINLFSDKHLEKKLSLNKSVFSCIDRFAETLNKEENDFEEDEFLDKEVLNDVYKNLNSYNNKIMNFLKLIQQDRVINNNESLFVSTVIFSAEEFGDSVDNIKKLIEFKSYNSQELEKELITIKISAASMLTLKKLLNKINHYFVTKDINI